MANTTSVKHRILKFQQLLASLGHLVEVIVMATCCALLLSLTVVLFLQVVFRYVLEQSLAWSEEAARFGLVWLGMLSATIAARKGFHFLFRWGTLALGATARAWLRQAVNFFVIGFLSLILRSSFTYLEIGATETAPATGVNMRIPFAAITVGLGLLIAVYVLEILDALCSMITGHRFSEREQEELRIHDLLTQKRTSHSSDELKDSLKALGKD